MQFVRSFLLLPLLLLLPVASTIAAPVATATKQTTAPTSGQSTLNGVTQVAGDAGVSTCLGRIEQVSQFITAKSQSKFLMFLPTTDANRQMTSASFEVQLSNQQVGYATMTAAPALAGCDALYETVIYWPDDCDAVAEKNFSQAKLLGVIQKEIKALEAGPTLRIFLMPAGEQGCVSIKKEVIF